MTNENKQLVPLVELDGKEYLVDVQKRQFRNFRDSDDIIQMHSRQGRQMVKDMQGSEWNSAGPSTGAEV